MSTPPIDELSGPGEDHNPGPPIHERSGPGQVHNPGPPIHERSGTGQVHNPGPSIHERSGTGQVHNPEPPIHERSGPGQEYNPGPPTLPRQAATVILLRGGGDGLELLLVKRNPAARFMGGVWVFPGGAVEQTEGDDDRAHRAAAVRELREEAGVQLSDPAELVKFSRWITPELVRTRFDTHFFLASLPPGQEPRVDGEECVDLGWYTPAGALEAHRAGEILLVFPTIKHLEQLSPFPSAAELLAYARGRTVEAVQPHVVLAGEVARVLLPGEPGY